MPDLDEQLRAVIEAAAEPLRFGDVVPGRPGRARRRSRWLAPMAVGLAALVVAAAVVAVRGGRGQQVTTAPPPVPTSIVAWRSDSSVAVLDSGTGQTLRVLDRDVAVVRALPTVAVTPDGSTVYYSRSRRPAPGECAAGAVDEIARVATSGGSPSSVTPGVYPAISPNGRYLAYTRNATDPCNTDHTELVVQDLESGIERTWTSPRYGQDADLSFLSWASDSTHLGYYETGLAGTPSPQTLHVLTAQSLDDATPIPRVEGVDWAGFGAVGTNLGARTRRDGGVDVMQLDATTGAVTRDLFALPGGLVTSNAFDGPEDALRADPSGRHVLALGLLPPGAAIRHGALFRWDDGQGPPRLLADGIDRAIWMPTPTPRAPAPVTACPGTPHITAQTGPDGLPVAASNTTSLAHVQQVLADQQARVRRDHPGVVSLRIGFGGGYEWDRNATGDVIVRAVKNYAIYVTLATPAHCPLPDRLNTSYDGIGITFLAPEASPG